MEVSDGIDIVGELPAVYIKQHKALVIADTHIGFEEDMADKGFYIPCLLYTSPSPRDRG